MSINTIKQREIHTTEFSTFCKPVKMWKTHYSMVLIPCFYVENSKKCN